MLGQRLLLTIGATALAVLPSAPLTASPFVRGDVDAGGAVDITDAIQIFGFLFLGNPESLPCADAADADDTGEIELSDGIYVLNSLFSGGPAAPPPTSCGEDVTPDRLDCDSFPPCDDGNVIDTVLASALVTPTAGGLVQVASRDDALGGASVEVPAGAVSEPVTLTMGTLGTLPSGAPFGQQPAGKLFRLEPVGLTFAEEVILSLPVSPGDDNADLYIGRWDESSGTWENLGGTVSGDFVSTAITHLSVYGVFDRGRSLALIRNEAEDLRIEVTYISGPAPPPDLPEGVPFPAYRPLPEGGVDLEPGESRVVSLLAGRYHFVVSYPGEGVANSLFFTIPELTEGADDSDLDQTITITRAGASSTDEATDNSIVFAGAVIVEASNLPPTLDCSELVPAGVAVGPGRRCPVAIGPIKIEQLRPPLGGVTLSGTATDPEGATPLHLFWTWSEGTLPTHDDVPSGGTKSRGFKPNPLRAGTYRVFLTAYDQFDLFSECCWEIDVVANEKPIVRVVPDDFIIDFGRLDRLRKLPLLTNNPETPLPDAVPQSGSAGAPPITPPAPIVTVPFGNLCGYIDTTLDGVYDTTYLRTLLAYAAASPDRDTCVGPHVLDLFHVTPCQYPSGMTCVFAIVADADVDPLSGSRGFQRPIPRFGKGNLYAAIPVPNAATGGAGILLPDGRTVASVLPSGLVAGSMLDTPEKLEAYNATLMFLAGAGALPTPANSAFVLNPEDPRHERLQTSDLYLLVFDMGSAPEIVVDDIVTQINPLRTAMGRVTEVIVVEGSWSGGDAKGYLWLTDVDDVGRDPTVDGDFLAGFGLLVDGVLRATVTAIGQALPVIFEAPDDPDAGLSTHDCRHLPFPDGCRISKGGTVNIEARVSDGFSREQRDYGTVGFPDEICGKGNRCPRADDQTVTTSQDTPVAITLSGSDEDGDTLTYSVLTQPTNGELSGTGADRTYTPNPGFQGSDSFTFTVHDGLASAEPATVSITVEGASLFAIEAYLTRTGVIDATNFPDFDPTGSDIQLSGSPSAPTISWAADTVDGPIPNATMVSIELSPSRRDVWGIEDTIWDQELIPKGYSTNVIAPPVVYGDFSVPNTNPFSNVENPAPKLTTGTLYQVRISWFSEADAIRSAWLNFRLVDP